MFFFFFQAEDGIRDLVRSRGLGDVYKRQSTARAQTPIAPRRCRLGSAHRRWRGDPHADPARVLRARARAPCLLYTSDAADERSSVDLGGRRLIKKKKT